LHQTQSLNINDRGVPNAPSLEDHDLVKRLRNSGATFDAGLCAGGRYPRVSFALDSQARELGSQPRGQGIISVAPKLLVMKLIADENDLRLSPKVKTPCQDPREQIPQESLRFEFIDSTKLS